MPLVLILLALNSGAIGCLYYSRGISEITLFNLGTRLHHDPEGSNYRICPLVDDNKVRAVIIRIATLDDIIEESRSQEIVDGKFSNTYSLDGDRNGICCWHNGATLTFRGHLYAFTKKTLADGPWIYCFDHSEAPYRIRVPHSEIDRFETEVYELTPLEIATNWCNPTLGERVDKGEFIQ